VSEVEILARLERRRKWSIEEKAALIAEVEAEGGAVKLVAQRHRISESLLYNWRAAWKAAAAAAGSSAAVAFVPRSRRRDKQYYPHRRYRRASEPSDSP
jgi:transposase